VASRGNNGIFSGKAEFIREYNRWLVANLLRREGPLSRVDLAARLGLSAPAVSRIVESLLAEGFVEETGLAPSTVGRRARLLEIRAEAGTALGIDLRRVTEVQVGLVDIMGNYIGCRRKALRSLEPDEVVEVIGGLAELVVEEFGSGYPGPIAAGLACPGVIEYAEGRVEYSAHLGWHNVPIAELLRNRLNLQVFVDTDCNAPALAESWLGSGADVSHLVYLTLGPGLGIGMVIDGEVYRGAMGAAGEIGHTVIQVQGGRPCRCGALGCVETFLSDEALVRLAVERYQGRGTTLGSTENLAVRDVFVLAERGDAIAGEVVAQAGEYLQAVVVNIVNLLNPQVLVFDGYPEVVDALLPYVRRAARERALPLSRAGVRVVRPSLGEVTGLVGAAMLVLERFWRAPVFDIEVTYHELTGTRSIGQPCQGG